MANYGVHGPNPVHCLFFYGLWATNGFHIFKWLKKKNFMTHKNYKIHIIQLYGYTVKSCPFIYLLSYLRLLSYYKAELNSCKRNHVNAKV